VSHFTTPGLPLDRNPALRPGIDALSFWLAEQRYSTHAIGRILAHAATEGTPTGSPYLDPEDEAGATDAFVDALAPVPCDSLAWDDPGVYLDAESIREAADGRGAVDRSIPADAVLEPPELDDFEMEPGP
jgi:hypothetical protein